MQSVKPPLVRFGLGRVRGYQALLKLIIGVFLVSSLLLLISQPNDKSADAAAGINEQLNFQARLLNDDGSLIPDGFWNIRFKIYCGGDGDLVGAGTGTDCTHVENEDLLWTETYDYNGGAPDQRVRVANGYVSVQLNSLNDDFSGVDWNQDNIWLSIDVGGSGTSAVYDGEMEPFIRFTSVPYAFNSDQLDGRDSSGFVQLDPGASPQTVSTANTAIAVNQQGAGNLLQLQTSGVDVLTLTNAGALQVTTTGANASFGISSSGGSGRIFSLISTTSGDLIVRDSTGSANRLTITAAGDTTFNPGGADADFTIQSDTHADAFQIEGAAGTPRFGALDCTGNTNGGAITADSAGTLSCTDDDTGGGTGEWTDTGTFLHPADLSGAEDVGIGGTTTGTADIWLQATGAAVFNEQGADADFRIESDTLTNAFFLDGTNGIITLGAYDCTGANGGALTAVSGVLTCTDDDGAGAAPDLQDVYDNSGTPAAVTLATGKNIEFTLPNVATDPNFLINIATGSSSVIELQNNGTAALRVDSSGVDLLDVDVADFSSATVTFDTGEIEGADILDGTIEEVDLEVTNAPTDNWLLSYDSTSGGFTWIDPASAGADTFTTIEVDATPVSTAAPTLNFNGTDFSLTESPADDFAITIQAERIQDLAGAMVTGNTETGIAVTYQDADGTFDFVVDNLENLAGTLDVASGGTGATTLTDGGVLLGSGTGAITATAVLTNGQLLIGDGTGDPTVATLTEGAGINVTNGAGSITVAATLGVDIISSEIVNGTVGEIDLNISNAESSGWLLSSDGAGGFTWIDPASAGLDTFTTIEVDATPVSTGAPTLNFNGTDFSLTESPADDFAITIQAERIQDLAGAMVTGNTETGIAVTYQDADGTFDFVVDNLENLAGTLDVASGGTGVGSFTSNGILYGNGTGVIQVTAAGTTGQCLVGNTSAAPTWGSCGTGEFTDTGTFLHPADLSGAEDVGIGGTTTGTADIWLQATGAAVFNEQGADADFRIESDTLTNAFFLDGTNGIITLGAYDCTGANGGALTAVSGVLTCTDDDGAGAAPDLQDVYDNSSTGTIQTASGKNITFSLTDSATDSDFVVDILGTGNIFEVRDGGTPAFTIADGGALTATGNAVFKPGTDGQSAFVIQEAGGQAYLTVDTESATDALQVRIGGGTDDVVFVLDAFTTDPTGTIPDGAMFYDSDGDVFRCRVNGAWVNCDTSGGTGDTITQTLIPEFGGGTLVADGGSNTGTMSAGSVAGLSPTEGEKHNYYDWRSNQASVNDYDVVINYQLPSDFNASNEFNASSWKVWTYSDNLADTTITITIEDENETVCISAANIEFGTVSTWGETTLSDPSATTDCDFAPNEIMRVIIKMGASNNSRVRLGEIEFSYDT